MTSGFLPFTACKWLLEWIEAARAWSIQEVETRLAMSLEKAYERAGLLPPLWMMDSGRSKAQDEPKRFLVELLDGVKKEDDRCGPLAMELFGDVPHI